MQADLSFFTVIGSWIFSTAKELFESFVFNFGEFTLNGWLILLGCAILYIVIHFIARIFD